MHSLWDDKEAGEFIDRYAAQWGEVLALRVYSSRLIGRDADLVLHGGGNTSAKGQLTDLLGEAREVIFVKGSGWDLIDIEPEGLPALDLPYLRKLRRLEALTDEEMVNQLRTQLLNASAPNPSVETLLHAFLPHAFVDHSHADAILALSNQEEGVQHVQEALGERVAVLPYIMPGFPLAKAVADAYEARPECEGVLLHQHGLFSFGEDARESYERHISLVDAAERYIERAGKVSLSVPVETNLKEAGDRAARLAPVLRGALSRMVAEATGASTRFVVEWRTGAEELRFADSEQGRGLALTPPLTPDHTIRTKSLPCWLDLPWDADDESLQAAVESDLNDYGSAYRGYFERGTQARGSRKPLDPAPRLLLAPGCGLFAVGTQAKAARIAADIAEHTLKTKAISTVLGSYRGLDELDLFDMEYWSLEQAKLGKAKAPELAGRVAVVTGGAGAIGEGVAQVLAAAGAVVVLLDLELERVQASAERVRQKSRGECYGLAADVTDAASLQQAFDEICRRSGGVDVLVPNAGIAHVASLLEMEPADFRRVVEVNQTGVLLSLQVGGRVMTKQGIGGSVVIISSKNVLGPGADFGAYSASKAGAHQLGRVAALEWAKHGIHVNMVCPDAVFRHGENPSGLWSEVGPNRAASRGLTPEDLESYYLERSLLKRPVTAEDVGAAVLFLAAQRTPTTGAVLPVDSGVPAAFPR